MKLSYLLNLAGMKDFCILKDIEIEKIETNSGKVTPENANNTLFVCIKGANYDTHNDIDMLVSLGIPVIIAEKTSDNKPITSDSHIIFVENCRKTLALLSRVIYGFPDKEMTLVGVTGTKGKTTVTYMLSEICRQMNVKSGIIGTNGAFFDNICIEIENSTPGSVEFCNILYQMKNSGVKYVFCEVTSQALMQHRVYGIKFDIAAFTNLFPDHIGKNEHNSYEDYRECKSKLFCQAKRAVLNGDDEEYSYFVEKCKECGVPYRVYFPTKSFETIRKSVRLPGTFNVANAVCAYNIAKMLGIPERYIIKGIEEVKVKGRCECVENPCGVRIIIDYAHNKESLCNVLSALRENCCKRLICVFGAGGDRSPLRRRGMGEAAVKFADFSVVTNDNPRNEPPLKIIEDIVEGMKDRTDKYTVIPDRREAIHYALSMANEGDTVLLAGKGAQMYEEICGERYDFDEREIVSQYYETVFRKN